MKFAFVVAASVNYYDGIKAMLNSLKCHGNTADVVFLKYEHPDNERKFGDLLTRDYGYTIKRFKHKQGQDQIQGTAIDRFKLAYEIRNSYDAICLLDADMFITANVNLFFEIAAAGFIVTGSNGMIINFNKGYQEYYNLDLGKENIPYTKVHTTVPIFINKDNMDWFKTWYEFPRKDHFDDFLFLNMVGIKLGKDKKMLCMPPYIFTGIHHWMLKPETAVMRKGGTLLSGTEEQVYIVHGKWWDQPWIDDLSVIMFKYLKDQDFGPRNEEKVRCTVNLLCDEFKNYLDYY